jgi:endonuclease YncB( thermonuclease family)
LLQVDAPERGQFPWEREVREPFRDFLRSYTKLLVRYNGQSWERTTCDCWTPEGEWLNCEMVRRGK